MPAAPNHFDFAQDCLARRGAAGLPIFPAALHAEVLMGTQGSDPFYTFGRLPWLKRPRQVQVEAFADFIHSSDPADVFPPLVACIAKARSDLRPSLAAYLYGALLHYILDRAVHPFVYFRTGFDEAGRLSGIYSRDHLRFEAALAATMRSRRPVPSNERAAPTAPAATLSAIGELYAAAFPGHVVAKDFPAAWKDFVVVRWLIRDPWGIKGAILDFFNGSTQFRAMMRKDRPSFGDTIDYANDKRTLWLRPSDGTPSVASVQEMYGQALKDADRLGGFLELALRGGISREDWDSALGGMNHEGCRRGETPRYFRSVYRPGDERLPAL